MREGELQKQAGDEFEAAIQHPLLPSRRERKVREKTKQKANSHGPIVLLSGRREGSHVCDHALYRQLRLVNSLLVHLFATTHFNWMCVGGELAG